MFTVGSVHTRDHDPGYSGANSGPTARRTGRWVLYYTHSGI